jgi:hypothetical protein
MVSSLYRDTEDNTIRIGIGVRYYQIKGPFGSSPLLNAALGVGGATGYFNVAGQSELGKKIGVERRRVVPNRS